MKNIAVFKRRTDELNQYPYLTVSNTDMNSNSYKILRVMIDREKNAKDQQVLTVFYYKNQKKGRHKFESLNVRRFLINQLSI